MATLRQRVEAKAISKDKVFTDSETESNASFNTDSDAEIPKAKEGFAYARAKLITKEDPFMIHKIGGIFVCYDLSHVCFHLHNY